MPRPEQLLDFLVELKMRRKGALVVGKVLDSTGAATIHPELYRFLVDTVTVGSGLESGDQLIRRLPALTGPFDVLFLWMISYDLARLEAGLNLCPAYTKQFKLHAFSRQKILTLASERLGRIRILRKSSYPCESSFCPYCATRRLTKVTDPVVLSQLSTNHNAVVLERTLRSAKLGATSVSALHHGHAVSSNTKQRDKILYKFKRPDFNQLTDSIDIMSFYLLDSKANKLDKHFPIAASVTSLIRKITLPSPHVLAYFINWNPDVIGLAKNIDNRYTTVYGARWPV